ncbi:hypothetical protein [Salinithrix halophila]|uniref:Spore coat protein n=1 Tax=Salinithrix halophila TaxID=1485204 RepID=A0ABV8JJQ0_9BACL
MVQENEQMLPAADPAFGFNGYPGYDPTQTWPTVNHYPDPMAGYEGFPDYGEDAYTQQFFPPFGFGFGFPFFPFFGFPFFRPFPFFGFPFRRRFW